jgi:hypothetical protein
VFPSLFRHVFSILTGITILYGSLLIRNKEHLLRALILILIFSLINAFVISVGDIGWVFRTYNQRLSFEGPLDAIYEMLFNVEVLISIITKFGAILGIFGSILLYKDLRNRKKNR